MTRLLLLSCLAASAGVHLALAGGHGPSFHLAALLLAAAAAAVALRPGRASAAAAGALLAGLLGAYAAEHGLAFDGVALATVAAETLGVAAAARLALRPQARRAERRAPLALAGLIAAAALLVTPAPDHPHGPDVTPHGHAAATER